MSGDDHDYCKVIHKRYVNVDNGDINDDSGNIENGSDEINGDDVVEISVNSFSFAMVIYNYYCRFHLIISN